MNFLSNRYWSRLPFAKGLGRTLFMAFIAISLLPLASISKIGYENARKFLLKNVEDSLNAASQLKSERMDSFLTERLLTLREQSGSPTNINLLTELAGLFNAYNGSMRLVQDTPEWPVLYESEAEGLRTVLKRDDLYDIYLLDQNGNLLFSAAEKERLGKNIYQDVEAPLSKVCRMSYRAGRPFCSDVDFRGQDREHEIIYLAHPVRSEGGAVEGVMVFAVSMRQVNQFMLEKNWLGKTGETYLVGSDMINRSGIGASHALHMRHRLDTPLVRQWLAEKEKKDEPPGATHLHDRTLEPSGRGRESYTSEKAVSYQNFWGGKVLGVSREIPLLRSLGLDWIVVAEISEDEAFAPARILQQKILNWMFFIAFVILLLSGFLASRMVGPVQKLSLWARKVAAGDLSHENTVDAKNEIGEMSESFMEVVDSFRAISAVCEAIAVGDLEKRVQIKSERDILGKSVNQMGDNLRSVVRQANRIAAGDYSIEIQPRSDRDELGIALEHMTNTLRSMTAENERSLEEARKLIFSLDNLPTPIYTVDRNFNILYINPAAALLVGLPANDCIGAKCQGLFRTSLCHTRECPAERVKRENKMISGENAVDADDLNIPVEFTATPIQDMHGNMEAILLHLNDITQRKKVLEEMRRKEWVRTGQVRLGEILRGVHDLHVLGKNIITFLVNYLDAGIGVIYLADEDETLHLLSSYAHPAPEQLKKTFHLGEGLIGEAALAKKTIHLTEVPENYIQIHSAFGGSRPRSLFIAPVIFDGQVIGVLELGSFFGFSSLQREFIEQVLEYIGISVATSQSRKKLEELLLETQLQAEQLLVQQEELRQANEELEEQTKALTASEEELQAQQEEMRVTNEELEERTRALEEQQDNIRKKNEELEDAKSRLVQKTKDLETISNYKSEFLANMSHELRTPLNSMLLLSNLLSTNKEGNLTEKQIEYARTVHNAGTDLLRLINDILDLSKVEAGKITLHIDSLKLSDLADSIEKMFSEVARKKGLYFNVTIEEDTPREITTDQQRVNQVLKNFLANSLKFTEQGGVTLRIYRAECSGAAKNIGEERIAFAVGDTGIGIPDAKKALIFEEFQQVDGTTTRKYGGTGLGLSISKKFAELLGGEITVTSKEGEGSTFTLLLPLAFPREEKENSAQQTAGNEQLHGKSYSPDGPDAVPSFEDDRETLSPSDRSILVIEDDPFFSRILRDFARQKQFKAILAPDGETGLQLAQLHEPSAILLDIGLPGMNGWRVMRELKNNNKTRHIPVHFVTGNQRAIEAMKMGAIGLLAKPVDMGGLLQAFSKIERILSKSVKHLLIVEDDEERRKNLISLIEGTDVDITVAVSGYEAHRHLTSDFYDCLILNVGLKDESGLELLDFLRKESESITVPVILFADGELTPAEVEKIAAYQRTIVIKETATSEEILDEVALFLHRVEEDLPKGDTNKTKPVHDKKAVFRNKKILIVDDDMRNVFVLTSILEEKGLKIVVAKNGQEALDRFNNEKDIDLILMDIMLPGMDGYEVMRAIRGKENHESLPIIALTAKAMKGDRNKCIEAGANDYMAKPVDTDRLLSLLQVWLYK